MYFDFAALLVLATVVTGGLWALDVMVWRPQRRRRAAESAAGLEGEAAEQARTQALKEPVLVEYARSFFPVILVVLVLRSFVAEPFRIPSGSMMPTLLAGDFILVNKYTYGIRLPVANWEIIDMGDPKRGDVAVFRYPKDPSIDYIKRVVGLPGDHVAYRNDTVYVNGEPVAREPAGTFRGEGAARAVSGARLYSEHLADKPHHIVLERADSGLDVAYEIPDGHYFMVGDNRHNSNDSRYWGPVAEEHLVGRAFMIWMNWDPTRSSVTWSRIGQRIQ